MTTAMLPKAFPFQSSLETIRAHHWRHFMDVYAGCEFNCQYCLYRAAPNYGAHVRASPTDTSGLIPRGIVDIGAATDPYQPIEKRELRTRHLLETLLEHRTPVFVLTRGTLVTRDRDILARMAEQGLVEVCFSLITLDEEITRVLEPGAPPPVDRLSAAKTLSSDGIPVSFHVAPLIPGLDSPAGLEDLAQAAFEAGARHIFTAVLGARQSYWDAFVSLLESIQDRIDSWDTFRAAYPPSLSFSGDAADTCDIEHAVPVFQPIRSVAIGRGATFISENYPAYTTGALTGGIYRWKLPTVYDMGEWIRNQGKPVDFASFVDSYYRAFDPPDALLEVVESLWTDGSLFVGAMLKPRTVDGQAGFEAASEYPSTFSKTTLVTKRKALQ